MINYYLAGPWFTEKGDILEKYAYNMYESLENKTNCKVFRPRTSNSDTAFETYLGNIKAIEECDVLLALISEKDVGTAFEIGYALAKNKTVILIGFNEQDFKRKTNMMLAFSSSYCITIDKLWKVYSGCLDIIKDTVNFSDKWEDIE